MAELRVEQVAAIHAAIRASGDAATVLRDANVTEAEWPQLQLQLVRGLEAELQQGTSVLCRRYLDASQPRTGASTVSFPRIGVASNNPDADATETTLDPVLDRIRQGTKNKALPFDAPSGKLPAPAPEPEVIVQDDGDGGTIMGNVGLDATLPFQKQGLQSFTRLSDYARLVAELRHSDDADALLNSRGLVTPKQRRDLHELWQLRFDANPDLRKRLEELVAQHSRGRGRL